MPAEARNALALENQDIAERVVHQGKDHWLLEDLRQEAFIGLLTAADRYDPARGSFRAFATQRAMGAVRDYMRHYPSADNRRPGKRAAISLETDAPVAEWHGQASREPDPAMVAESADDVAWLLRGLSARSRLVVLHYVVGGRLYREIAADLGITASRCCQIYHEAMRELRRRTYAGCL